MGRLYFSYLRLSVVLFISIFPSMKELEAIGDF